MKKYYWEIVTRNRSNQSVSVTKRASWLHSSPEQDNIGKHKNVLRNLASNVVFIKKKGRLYNKVEVSSHSCWAQYCWCAHNYF